MSIAAILKDQNTLQEQHAAKIIAEQNTHIVCDISISSNKLTCPILLGHNYKTIALLDTGSNICLIKNAIFKSLPYHFRRLEKCSIEVISASGDKLHVRGECQMPIKIGNRNFTHSFIIVENLKQTCIIGLDFMRKFNANINLPRNILTLEDEDIQLQNFSNIASKGRLSKTQTFKPHTMSIIYVTPKRHYMNQDICYQISSAESPHIQNEPGLYVMNTITKVHDNGLIPCILVNNTGKTYNFVKGNYIAKITPTLTDEFEISEIN